MGILPAIPSWYLPIYTIDYIWGISLQQFSFLTVFLALLLLSFCSFCWYRHCVVWFSNQPSRIFWFYSFEMESRIISSKKYIRELMFG
ncbi:hypothetical protein Peur_045751 [Populus x canadensis]